ncbi:chaplin [Streptomyces sp. NPDC001436]
MKKRLMRGTTLALAGTALLTGGAGLASAHGGASAEGLAAGSPGVLSGNLVQVPVDIPVNVCGNTAQLVGFLNPAFGNTCVNA